MFHYYTSLKYINKSLKTIMILNDKHSIHIQLWHILVFFGNLRDGSNVQHIIMTKSQKGI